MKSSTFGKILACSAALPALLGTACSKRSGLDRGDANARLFARSSESPSGTQRGDDSDDDSRPTPDAPASGQFAAPPTQRPSGSFAVPQDKTNSDEQPRDSAEFGAIGKRSATRSRPSGVTAAPAARSESSAQGQPRRESKQGYADAYERPRSRPGLGTSWGETRASAVRTVSFERDDLTRPTSITRIFYNDSSGIAAQAGERPLSLGPNFTELERGFVGVEIVDPQGIPLPGVNSNGHVYVVGHDGDRYAIRIRNRGGERVEIVATVDGLDVIDGTAGNYRKRGYVIDGYSTLLIEGFRRSTSAIASFRFGAVSESYAARTGNDRHVGVIGIALFTERGCCTEEYTSDEVYRRETADPFPSQFARPPRPRSNLRAE